MRRILCMHFLVLTENVTKVQLRVGFSPANEGVRATREGPQGSSPVVQCHIGRSITAAS